MHEYKSVFLPFFSLNSTLSLPEDYICTPTSALALCCVSLLLHLLFCLLYLKLNAGMRWICRLSLLYLIPGCCMPDGIYCIIYLLSRHNYPAQPTEFTRSHFTRSVSHVCRQGHWGKALCCSLLLRDYDVTLSTPTVAIIHTQPIHPHRSF